MFIKNELQGKPITFESISVPKLTVESLDNHVYFYSYVDEDRCLALIKTLKMLDNQLRNERLNRSIPDEIPSTPIWLHIQSIGGDLFAALALVDQIPQIKTPIYSVVEGCCASAATLISMSCAKRYILPNSFMLVHELSTVAWGKYHEIQDEVVLMDMMMENLIKFYAFHSGLNKKVVKKMLGNDTWWNAEQCLEGGFVDEIGGA